MSYRDMIVTAFLTRALVRSAKYHPVRADRIAMRYGKKISDALIELYSTELLQKRINALLKSPNKVL